MRHGLFARRCARAFTFLEVMVVVVIVGILAAIVIPRFGNVTEEAKASALQGALGGVRSAIASYRAKAVISGSSPFPSSAELVAVGTVVQQDIPKNPYTGASAVQTVSASDAASRLVSNPTAYGWNYWVDNSVTPPQCIFYANSDATTTVTDGSGVAQTANKL